MTRSNPHLHIINGGLAKEFAIAGVTLMISPPDRAPFSINAHVREEDTYLLLDDDPYIHEPAEDIHLLSEAASTFEPIKPGKVLRMGGTPMQLIAIVYDVEQEPMCREEWIDSALAELFNQGDRYDYRAIGLPLLGLRHGHFAPQRFLVRLIEALYTQPHRQLQRIWLMVPPAHLAETHRWLSLLQA